MGFLQVMHALVMLLCLSKMFMKCKILFYVLYFSEWYTFPSHFTMWKDLEVVLDVTIYTAL